MDRASLSDNDGRERLIYLRNPNVAPYDGLVPIHVIVTSPTYELRARAEIGPDTRIPEALTAVAARAQGDATYELWGIGNYRVEGPLLVLKFTGDQLGHFQVAVSLSEGLLRMKDEFQTDQSCLSSFLIQLKAIGERADA